MTKNNVSASSNNTYSLFILHRQDLWVKDRPWCIFIFDVYGIIMFMETIKNKEKEILIVEDDPCYAFVLEKTLDVFFKTTTVSNGYDAVVAVEKNSYDAILMDINLGNADMDGLRTMRLIKQLNKNRRLKIFAMTAFSDAREWYIKQGFEDLFIKPIEKERIIHILNDKLTVTGLSKSLIFPKNNLNAIQPGR